MTQTTDKFRRSYDVQALIELLEKAAVGEVVEYSRIDAVIGDHSTPRGAGRIQSARRVLLRDKQMVFAAVERVGLQRLNDSDIIKTGADSVARIRRESIRGAKRLACVKYEELSDAEKRKHDAYASHLGILAECSRPQVSKKIAAAVDQSQEVRKLTFEETLKAFR